MAKEKPLIYCILEALGAAEGTYKAWDPEAEREVVLHFLSAPGEVELDRMEREALAAASISHPGLCRVFDVAEHCGRPFVVRELVEGRSLRARIAGAPLAWGELLGHALEMAAAIEAMHSTVIFHRHVSSATIFLNAQGHAKLAGFAFAPSPGQVRDPSATAPEQLAGEAGEVRSDLYALGAVLYEMAAGVPPAAGEPRPLAELRGGLAPAFYALVRILLETDPAARFQSAEGLMRALTILKRGRGSVEVMNRLRNLESSRKRRRRIRRREERWRKRVFLAQVAGTLLVVFAIGVIVRLLLPHYRLYARLEMKALTATGDVADAAVSPDGRYFVQVRFTGGGYGIWRWERGSGRTVPLLPAGPAPRRDLAFSADGRMLYFVEGAPEDGTLFRIPVEGGTLRRLVSHVVTAAVSPDGARAAYIRSAEREISIWVGRPDGSDERLLLSRGSGGVPTALAWHPDNRKLAVCLYAMGLGAKVFVLDSQDGTFEQIGWHVWHGRMSLGWLPRGDAMIAAGTEAGGASPLWRIAYPGGETVRLNRGPATYTRISLSADGRHMAALHAELRSAIWVLPGGDTAAARPITGGALPDGVGGLAWTPSGRIVFPSREGDNRGLWMMDADGGHRQALLAGPEFASTPAVAPDGRSIAFLWYNGGGPRIWSMDADGKNVRSATRGGGEFFPSFSPDGRLLYFLSAVPNFEGIWTVGYEGGPTRRISNSPAVFAALSPDGKLLAYRTNPPDGSSEAVVLTTAGSSIAARFPMKEFTQLGWTRDSDGVIWARTVNGAGNLWLQPLKGGDPRPITAFASGEVFSFAWSRDYRTLAVARGSLASDVVLVNDSQ